MTETSRAGSSRGGTIRDPIHNDIKLDALEKAIIDTRIFQRLRYIKQNGLLHFVFPGAVHTRFAHSVGTMHIASRVAMSLFGSLYERLPAGKAPSLDYLSRVFRLAALLHDVGHCAFSHSIEHVLYEGKPLLGTTRELFTGWDEGDLLREYEAANKEKSDFTLDSAVSHEAIGLILVRRIFTDAMVKEVCDALQLHASDLGKDVRAVMDGGLSTSDRFQQASLDLADAVGELVDDPTSDMAEILHVLVSGTLDVDRLDYLVRDSFHCGAAYGLCQVDLLVSCLSLGVVARQVKLLLSLKAAHALDDMLWSRYQLFLQVLNHKTNVGLNSLLEKAIPDAIDELPSFSRPTSYDDFITFIDDYVIGTLFHVATHTKGTRRFTKLLVDRRVPRHLDAVRLEATESRAQREATEIERLAKEHGIDPEEIFTGVAESKLLKSEPPPLLVSVNRKTGRREFKNFEEVSSVIGKGKMAVNLYRVLHFFTERD
jgi:HD superfamily phosphohydrolase